MKTLPWPWLLIPLITVSQLNQIPLLKVLYSSNVLVCYLDTGKFPSLADITTMLSRRLGVKLADIALTACAARITLTQSHVSEEGP